MSVSTTKMNSEKEIKQLVTEAVQGSKAALEEIDELKQLSVIYNSVQPSDFDFVDALKNIYESNQFRIISDPRIN